MIRPSRSVAEDMWIERTIESVEEQQAVFDGMTARELEEHKKATGIHKSISFFQTIPRFNSVDMRQQDSMHMAVGLAEREGAQMIEHFVRRKREFSLGQYNATLLDFREDLDEPIDLPELHCSVLDRKNGISKGSLRMNSSQVHEFVRYRCRSPHRPLPAAALASALAPTRVAARATASSPPPTLPQCSRWSLPRCLTVWTSSSRCCRRQDWRATCGSPGRRTSATSSS